MIFSLIPLSALAIAPAIAGTINARKEDSIQARDWAPWTPGWSWPGTSDTCHPSIPENCPCLTKPVCGSDGLIKCPEPTCDYSEYNWHPIYENWNGWNGWKKTPYSTGYVNKDTYEIDCKNLCNANEGCNSCQVYTLEEAAEVFICALFEEILDLSTWEDDCDDWSDWGTWGYKPSWSSCWSIY
ncbi:hypothetical protein IW261DRAFT_1669575 [Armillaria novae-zelandiae]|uniref:Uncharacterized protein n=1 Tax=Armillaria novae-zelandiae TaxID=153914 RepID=A0AA39PJF8_9AGAR|nr:hypothetical protein IW261DRAFT_1669575 [Armillaria novae-zelandiae]